MEINKMSRKLFAFSICLLLVITLVPTTQASQNRSGTYKNCYIESSGLVTNRFSIGLFKIGVKAFILLLNVGFGENGTTTIYDSVDGNILWNNQGEQSIVLFFFVGNYSYIVDPTNGSYLSLKGNTIFARV